MATAEERREKLLKEVIVLNKAIMKLETKRATLDEKIQSLQEKIDAKKG